jgi:hypothetical protein
MSFAARPSGYALFLSARLKNRATIIKMPTTTTILLRVFLTCAVLALVLGMIANEEDYFEWTPPEQIHRRRFAHRGA